MYFHVCRKSRDKTNLFIAFFEMPDSFAEQTILGILIMGMLIHRPRSSKENLFQTFPERLH